MFCRLLSVVLDKIDLYISVLAYFMEVLLQTVITVFTLPFVVNKMYTIEEVSHFSWIIFINFTFYVIRDATKSSGILIDHSLLVLWLTGPICYIYWSGYSGIGIICKLATLPTPLPGLMTNNSRNENNGQHPAKMFQWINLTVPIQLFKGGVLNIKKCI